MVGFRWDGYDPGNGYVLVVDGRSLFGGRVLATRGFGKAWDVVGEGVPYGCVVGRPVFVGEDHAHSGHVFDGYVGESQRVFGGESGERVDNDLDLMGSGVAERPILVERISSAGDDFGDSAGRSEDVF